MSEINTECTSSGPNHCGKYSWCEGCAMMPIVAERDELRAEVKRLREGWDSDVHDTWSAMVDEQRTRAETAEADHQRVVGECDRLRGELDRALENNTRLAKENGRLRIDKQNLTDTEVEKWRTAHTTAEAESAGLRARLEGVRERIRHTHRSHCQSHPPLRGDCTCVFGTLRDILVEATPTPTPCCDSAAPNVVDISELAQEGKAARVKRRAE